MTFGIYQCTTITQHLLCEHKTIDRVLLIFLTVCDREREIEKEWDVERESEQWTKTERWEGEREMEKERLRKRESWAGVKVISLVGWR